MSLKNKTAIITGAASGIGKATALEMARHGVKLLLVDINLKELENTFEQIKHISEDVDFIKADVTKYKDVVRVVSKITRKHGKIDILVNSAGALLLKTIDETSEKEWDLVLKTNLKGIYLFVKQVSKSMKEHKQGKIINLASVAGIIGLQNSSAFAAANGGVVNLTKQLAIELSEYKINVNSVSPGIIATRLTSGLLADAKKKKELLLNIPLKRIGTPEEVAEAILFLAKDDSDFITGHNLVVDGGWSAH